MCYEVKIKDEAMQVLEEKYPYHLYGAKVIQVIEERIAIGGGTENDPNRVAILYRSLDGELLAVHDPHIK